MITEVVEVSDNQAFGLLRFMMVQRFAPIFFPGLTSRSDDVLFCIEQFFDLLNKFICYRF